MFEVSCILKTSDYRGDHAADCSIAIKCDKSMTIEDLIKTIPGYHEDQAFQAGKDHIEIRILQGKKETENNGN